MDKLHWNERMLAKINLLTSFSLKGCNLMKELKSLIDSDDIDKEYHNKIFDNNIFENLYTKIDLKR